MKKGLGYGADRILIPKSNGAGWPWAPLARITSLPFAIEGRRKRERAGTGDEQGGIVGAGNEGSRLG